MRALAREWRVDVDETFETPSSLIAYGRRGGDAVVLKVVKAPGDEWRSGEVVSAFDGHGVVRVLDHVPGALLLERVRPGTPLVSRVRHGHDAEATEIVAGVLAAMRPVAAPVSCASVRDWGRAFDWYMTSDDTRIPPPFVARAADVYSALCDTQGATRLLHGDLQHYNVLEDRERGWVAIDPKGVIGEVEFELGAVMRNPVELPELFANPATIERRVRVFSARLALDADRIVMWAFAQAVLSAIWHVQDGSPNGAEDAPLALARAMEPLVSSA